MLHHYLVQVTAETDVIAVNKKYSIVTPQNMLSKEIYTIKQKWKQ